MTIARPGPRPGGRDGMGSPRPRRAVLAAGAAILTAGAAGISALAAGSGPPPSHSPRTPAAPSISRPATSQGPRPGVFATTAHLRTAVVAPVPALSESTDSQVPRRSPLRIVRPPRPRASPIR